MITDTKLKNFLIKYKWIIIPGIPFLFFVLTALLFIVPRSPSSQNTNESVKITPTVSMPGFISGNRDNDFGEDGEESIEARPGIQTKEPLPDGTVKYILDSPISNRPNIIIAKDEHDVRFQRSVTLPDFPVKITDYTDQFGQAKWIFKGSVFYGPDTNSYLYPDIGLAFIANPKTGNVLEQHLFDSTKVEEYVKKYGDDIPDQP